MPPGRPALLGLTLLGVLVGFLAAVVIASEGPTLTLTRAQTPVPPCPTGWSEDAAGDACVRNTDVCNAWLSGTAREEVACGLESKDGRALVRWILEGSGSARIRLTDGSGQIVFVDRIRFPATGEHAVQGEAGAWRLAVDFSEAQGSARVVAWG